MSIDFGDAADVEAAQPTVEYGAREAWTDDFQRVDILLFEPRQFLSRKNQRHWSQFHMSGFHRFRIF